MIGNADSADIVIPPPLALGLLLVASFGLNWLYPLPFVPPFIFHIWIGAFLFIIALLLIRWSATTFRRAGTQVLISKTPTTVVTTGPYRFSRNPIYLALFLVLIAVAIGFDNLWAVAALAIFYFVIRFGVISREEIFLEHKFGSAYLAYKAHVRRWL
jgi:protein-S-isoprenylcysteine O-methyltransferase Ste14